MTFVFVVALLLISSLFMFAFGRHTGVIDRGGKDYGVRPTILFLSAIFMVAALAIVWRMGCGAA